ncbi:MAG TPA: HlyD family secretion protein [Rhizomicrobium sp.]|nr:HlyD family secretion protein [Rhizomicrobium sp.]
MAQAQDNPAPRPSPLQNPRTRRILLLAGMALGVIALAWAVEWFVRGRYLQSTDDAYLKADAVTIAPTVSGYVQRVFVGDNQVVKAGQPLLQVDTRTYNAALAQAQATVDARRADLERARAESDQQQATIAQAAAQLAVSAAAARFAAEQVDRYTPLAASGADTHERLDQLKDTRDQALATQKANAAALQSARRQLVTLAAATAQAKAQLEAAQASLHQSQIDLGHTLIRSTIAGRVGDRTVRVGQYVQPGTRLMSIVPVEQLYITANFKETQIGRMRPGQPVDIGVDALPDAHIRGNVESFAPGTGAQFALLPPENATGNFTKIVQRVPVRISVEASEAARRILVPGLSVTVTVDTKSGEDIR